MNDTNPFAAMRYDVLKVFEARKLKMQQFGQAIRIHGHGVDLLVAADHMRHLAKHDLAPVR